DPHGPGKVSHAGGSVSSGLLKNFHSRTPRKSFAFSFRDLALDLPIVGFTVWAPRPPILTLGTTFHIGRNYETQIARTFRESPRPGFCRCFVPRGSCCAR